MELPQIFKILGDDTRLRIFGLLVNSELCVCDLESVLGISQANVSRHLSRMKSSGILTSRKNAQWVYYSINSVFRGTYTGLVESIGNEFKKHPEYKKDIKTLAAVKKSVTRPGC